MKISAIKHAQICIKAFEEEIRWDPDTHDLEMTPDKAFLTRNLNNVLNCAHLTRYKSAVVYACFEVKSRGKNHYNAWHWVAYCFNISIKNMIKHTSVHNKVAFFNVTTDCQVAKLVHKKNNIVF